MPVISVIPTVLNNIDGFADPALLGSSVMVSAQLNGAIVRSGAPDTQTGAFFLARLSLGSYDVVITADGRVTAVIAGVPISSPTSTAKHQRGADLYADSTTRTISSTIILNPPNATTVAYVSSKQAFTARSDCYRAVAGCRPSVRHLFAGIANRCTSIGPIRHRNPADCRFC